MNWFTYDADRGPLSSSASYAYGYTDQKPRWSAWLVWAALIAVDVILIVKMWS